MFDAAALRCAIAEDRLDEQLALEVREHFHRLPLEAVCRNGGWPDGEAITLFVGGVVTMGEALTVTFSVAFQERSAAGCGNLVDVAPRTADFTLKIADDRCTLELRDPEPTPEF